MVADPQPIPTPEWPWGGRAEGQRKRGAPGWPWAAPGPKPKHEPPDGPAAPQFGAPRSGACDSAAVGPAARGSSRPKVGGVTAQARRQRTHQSPCRATQPLASKASNEDMTRPTARPLRSTA